MINRVRTNGLVQLIRLLIPVIKLGIQNPRKTAGKRTQLRVNQLGQDSEDPVIPPIHSLSKERQGEIFKRRCVPCPFACSRENLGNVVVPQYQFVATVTKNTHLQNYHIDDSRWWLSSV